MTQAQSYGMQPDDAGRATPPASSLLLVDDEQAFVDALAFRLKTRGIPCLTRVHGKDVPPLLDNPELEIVLLDINMPGIHGLETLRVIKAKRPDVEVILLTGEADLSVAAKGMRRGAGDYLLKPVDFNTLLESIEKARLRSREHKERLRAAEAVKLMALGALATGVGHEINNPLNIILQRAEWLQELIEDARDGRLDYAEMEKSSSIIQQQAKRAGAITAQLLDLAQRSREGRAESDLAALVQKVFAAQSERAASLNTDLESEGTDAIPPLPGSPAELEPVLSHLVRNALDAIEALSARDTDPATRHRVRISAEQMPGAVRILVEDSGEGIAPEHAARMYDPFFSTRAVGKGTGLGLTVCHSIISALRGSIRHSSRPGTGTVCTIILPTESGG